MHFPKHTISGPDKVVACLNNRGAYGLDHPGGARHFSPASFSADMEVLKRLVQIVAGGLYASGAIRLFLPVAQGAAARPA